jgi:nicotinamidase/pyrazinamidase
VSHVVLAGLARDYCVLWSAEDAADAGFETTVLWELTRPVDSASDERVRAALAARGVGIC